MTAQPVRVFEERHIEPALSLYRRCPGVGLSVGDSAPELARFLARNPGCSAVAETPDQALLGAVLCGHDGRRGFLYHLAVDPSSRGQGLGRALVAHSAAALCHAGISRLSVHVFADNAAGARFWAKLGWHTRADLSVLQLELTANRSLT
jgi:ribosomal protein S18 acetylase RimI-like enzyme